MAIQIATNTASVTVQVDLRSTDYTVVGAHVYATTYNYKQAHVFEYTSITQSRRVATRTTLVIW